MILVFNKSMLKIKWLENIISIDFSYQNSSRFGKLGYEDEFGDIEGFLM